MGEPGGLPSMGLHRVGHDWSVLAAAAAVSLQSVKKKKKGVTYWVYFVSFLGLVNENGQIKFGFLKSWDFKWNQSFYPL